MNVPENIDPAIMDAERQRLQGILDGILMDIGTRHKALEVEVRGAGFTFGVGEKTILRTQENAERGRTWG